MGTRLSRLSVWYAPVFTCLDTITVRWLLLPRRIQAPIAWSYTVSTHAILPYSTYHHIPDPGAGPFLSYSSLPDHLNLSCSASQVFPEPELSLTWYSEPYYDHHTVDMTTTTVRRGLLYDVSVTTMLSSSLSHQTVFSCSLEIPGTQFSLNKKTMYSPVNKDIARASQVSGVNIRIHLRNVLLFLSGFMWIFK